MNRFLRLFLLVSLGLNVGLGWTVLRDLRREPPRPAAVGRSWRDRPAAGDTASWRRVMHHRLDRLSSLLDLEPDQAARLQQLQAANGPRVRAQIDLMETARQRVRAATDAADYDPDAVRAALAGLRHAQADLDSLTQEFLLQEFAVMSPAQRARYLELLPLDPWRAGRSGRPEGHDGAGGRPGNRRRRAE